MSRIERRLDLHQELVALLGSSNVYFQPPESIKMKYPAIIYFRDSVNGRKADNLNYLLDDRYSVTFVDPDPDTDYIEKMLKHFKMCSYDRHYISDNLNHDVFTLYY